VESLCRVRKRRKPGDLATQCQGKRKRVLEVRPIRGGIIQVRREMLGQERFASPLACSLTKPYIKTITFLTQ
jgi:hypothetical protein